MTLYFHGPQIGGIGFWEGLSLYEICARLTNVPELHWTLHSGECAGLIERKFNSFLIPCYFILYISMLATLLRLCIWRCYYINKRQNMSEKYVSK